MTEPQSSVPTSTHIFIATETPANPASTTWLEVQGTGFDAIVPVVGLLILAQADTAARGDKSTTIGVHVTTRTPDGMPTQWRQAVERINLLGVSPLPTTITGTVELGSGGSRIGHVTLDLAVAELSIAYDDSNGIALDIPVPGDDAPIEVARLRSLFGD